MRNIHELLEIAFQERASDLVMKAGVPPCLRVDGQMRPLDIGALSPDDMREFAYGIIHSAARDRLLRNPSAGTDGRGDGMEEADSRMMELFDGQEIDLVFTIPSLARVRANVFLERGSPSAVLRVIPLSPGTIDDLHLPPVLKEIAAQPQGLIVITGPTGSGKTTTLAAIIEQINRTRCCNIFTIEEPIEYLFTDRKSVIHQREVGTDTHSFSAALRSVIRQSPDVIALGELRDAETMDVAMTAAEIGHLVLTTLHTVSAAATIDRILNSFPAHMHAQVAGQLSVSLLCVTSQRLVRCSGGKGRLPAVEVMTASPRVRKQIEDGEAHEVAATMREGQHFGMNTLNQALERLCHERRITREEALQCAGGSAELKQLLRREG